MERICGESGEENEKRRTKEELRYPEQSANINFFFGGLIQTETGASSRSGLALSGGSMGLICMSCSLIQFVGLVCACLCTKAALQSTAQTSCWRNFLESDFPPFLCLTSGCLLDQDQDQTSSKRVTFRLQMRANGNKLQPRFQDDYKRRRQPN